MSNKRDIQDIANSFKTYEQMFDELIEYGPETINYLYCNDGTWKRLEIEWMMDYFYDKDRKKWEYLCKVKETDFLASDEKNKELNICKNIIKND